MNVQNAVDALSISIHAPHTGGDRRPEGTCGQLIISIHAPHTGGDGLPPARRGWVKAFQSTPPIRGATTGETKDRAAIIISIHAPHTGGDARPKTLKALLINFNPRPPYGGRPSISVKALSSRKFQSSPPIRGATP